MHGITGHNFETRYPSDDSDQIWFQLVSEEKIFEKVYDVWRKDGQTDGRKTDATKAHLAFGQVSEKLKRWATRTPPKNRGWTRVLKTGKSTLNMKGFSWSFCSHSSVCIHAIFVFIFVLFRSGVNVANLWSWNITNMRQVQPETLPKNSNFSSCLQNIKLKNNTP